MTDHAALIAKLEALRERAVNDSFSVENEFATSANDEAECRQEREETNAAIDEAIAALQATPAGIEGYRLSAAVSLCAFEKAEAQLAAQRTALEQLEQEIRTMAAGITFVHDNVLKRWANRIAAILQNANENATSSPPGSQG